MTSSSASCRTAACSSCVVVSCCSCFTRSSRLAKVIEPLCKRPASLSVSRATSCCVRIRDDAERPVLMRSMSMRPVRGSVAACDTHMIYVYM